MANKLKSTIKLLTPLDVNKSHQLKALHADKETIETHAKRLTELFKNEKIEQINKRIQDIIARENLFNAIMDEIVSHYEIKYANEDLKLLSEKIKQQFPSYTEEQVNGIAKKIIAKTLIFDELNLLWNIAVTDAEVDETLSKYYETSNQSVREYKEDKQKYEDIRRLVLHEKTINEILRQYKNYTIDWESIRQIYEANLAKFQAQQEKEKQNKVKEESEANKVEKEVIKQPTANIQYIVCKTKEEIGETVGKMFIDIVKKDPNAKFILATGSSPITTYQYIVKDFKENKTDWSKVTTFNLDEYLHIAPRFKNQSYREFMNVNLFSHINIDRHNTFFPSEESIGKNYLTSMNLEEHPIDLAILGVGNNGHIAFNEPGTPIDSYTHVVTLDQSTRDANSRFFDNNINNVPKQAISMGLNEILSAKKIVLIATGKAKKDAITHLKLATSYDPQWPITALTQHSNVVIVTDNLE